MKGMDITGSDLDVIVNRTDKTDWNLPDFTDPIMMSKRDMYKNQPTIEEEDHIASFINP